MDVGVAKLVSRLSKSEIRIRHPPNGVVDAWRILGGHYSNFQLPSSQQNCFLRLPEPSIF
jgi:hypothetical protein